MEELFIKKSDLVGIQAIYRSGELIYSNRQAEIKKELNQVQVYGTDKKEFDTDQRI